MCVLPHAFVRATISCIMILILFAHDAAQGATLEPTESTNQDISLGHQQLDHSRCAEYEPLFRVSREQVLSTSMTRRDREKPRSDFVRVIKEFAANATNLHQQQDFNEEPWELLLDQYGDSLGPHFVGPPLTFIGLSLAICPFFCVARCCMANTCCNSRGPYTACEQWWPLLTYIALAVVTAIVAGLSWGDDVVILKAITGTMCEVEMLADDLQSFARNVNDPLDKTHALLHSASQTFLTAANQAGGLPELGFEHQLNTFNTSLFASIDDTTVALAQARAFDRSTTDSRVEDQLRSAAQHVFASLDKRVLTLASSLDDVQFNLLNDTRDGKHKGLVELVVLAKSVMDHLESMVGDDARKPLHEAQEVTNEASKHTYGIAVVLFAIIFFALATGLLMVAALISPLPNDRMWAFRLFTCSWSLTYVFMVLMFVGSGIMFPLTVVSEDMCAVVADIPNDLATWGNVSMSLFALAPDSLTYDTDHNLNRHIDRHRNYVPLAPDAGVWMQEAVNLAEGCFATPPRGPAVSLELDRVTDFVQRVASIQQSLVSLPSQGASEQSLLDAIVRLNETASHVTASLPTIHRVRSALLDLEKQHRPTNATTFEACSSPSCLGTIRQPTQERIAAVVSKACIAVCLPNVPHKSRVGAIADVRLANARVSLQEAVVAIQSGLVKTVQDMKHIGAAVATTAPLVTKSAEHVAEISKHDDCEFVKLRFFGIHKQVCDEALSATANISINGRIIALFSAAMLVMSVLITNRLFEPVFLQWDAKAAIRWIRRVDPHQARQLFFASGRGGTQVTDTSLRGVPEGEFNGSFNGSFNGYNNNGSFKAGENDSGGVQDLLEQQRLEYEQELAMQRAEFERLLAEQRREMLHNQGGDPREAEGQFLVRSNEKV
jgi:hypothetical protein